MGKRPLLWGRSETGASGGEGSTTDLTRLPRHAAPRETHVKASLKASCVCSPRKSAQKEEIQEMNQSNPLCARRRRNESNEGLYHSTFHRLDTRAAHCLAWLAARIQARSMGNKG